MPCYEMNTQSVEVSANDVPRILEVLKGMGIEAEYNGSYIQTDSIGELNLNKGRAEFQENRWDKTKTKAWNAFRVKYSKSIVDEAAKINKWILKKNQRKSSPNAFVATKW